ncbi:hypothetical protein QBC40DRAFT_333714 [Triangularia verruculosa]|uniref:Uncharacterized protein n=1 Tax=Triangularia verruculosa TaxID=2587418 RepID=A0AAN7AZL0_9PEZI|nr:hypothetical protein QBC40DRAFT_333714 [Triangularia verruculosa]
MADRHHHNPLLPSSRLITGTTTAHIPSKPSARLIQQPPGPSTSTTNHLPTASSVRRNLFQSQLSRRPPHPSSSTSNETIRLHHSYDDDDPYQDHPISPHLPPAPSPSADIVPRNSLGEIELLGDPPTPPLYDTDDDNNNNSHPPSSSPSHHHDHRKAEQLAARNRLTEAVRQHQLHQNKLLMSIPGSSSNNFAVGTGIGMQPPLNTQPEGKKTSPSPLLLFDNSPFLFSPDAPHCCDPFCSGPASPPSLSSSSSSSPSSRKLVYYPVSSSSPPSPEKNGRRGKKGKGKMVDKDDGYYSAGDHDDDDAENHGHGQSFAKTKKFTETELVEEVKAGLRAKVAALAQDNWMFEPEELPRPH